MAKKLSDRERAAQKAGVAVNYKAPASMQAKTIQPVKRPVSIQAAQRQSLQTKYQSLPSGVSGPAAPKSILAKNYLAAQKRGYDTVQQDKGAIGPAKPWSIYQSQIDEQKKKQRDLNNQEATRYKNEAEQARQETGIKGLFNKAKSSVQKFGSDVKNDYKTGGVVKAISKVQSTVRPFITGQSSEDEKRVDTETQSKVSLLNNYLKQGKISEKEYKDKIIEAQKPRLTGSINAFVGLAEPERGALRVAGNVLKKTVGDVSNSLKPSITRVGKGISESAGLSRPDKMIPKSALGKVARAAEEDAQITKTAENGRTPKEGENAPQLKNTTKEATQRERFKERNVEKQVSESPVSERPRMEDIRVREKTVKDKIERYVKDGSEETGREANKAWKEARQHYEDVTGEKAPHNPDELFQKLKDYTSKNLRDIEGRRAERMSSKEAFDSRRTAQGFKRSVGLPMRGKVRSVADRAIKEAEKRGADIGDQGLLQRFRDGKKLTPEELSQVRRIIEKNTSHNTNLRMNRAQENHYTELAKRSYFDDFKKAFPQGTDERVMKNIFLKAKQKNFKSPAVGETVPSGAGLEVPKKGFFNKKLKGFVKNPFASTREKAVFPNPERGSELIQPSIDLKAQQAGIPRYTKEDTKNLVNEMKYKASEDKKTFTQSFDKWVGKRDVAKTTGYQVGSKVDVPKGQEAEVIDAIETGKKGNAVADGFRSEFDRLFSEAKKAGIDVRYLKNYITHIWSQSPLEVEKIAENAAKKGFQFSQGRSIPTYKEGIELGLTPQYTNPRQILAHYAQKLEETKANLDFLNEMRDKGLIVDASVGQRSPGLVEIQAPGMIKSTSFGPEGTKIVGSYYATPDIAEQINRVFGAEPTDNVSRFFKGAAKVSSALQDLTLSGGIPKTPLNAFTFAQMTKDVLAGRIVSPFSAAIRSSFGKLDTAFQEKNLKSIKELQERNVPINTSLTLDSLGEDSFLKKAFTGGKEGKWNAVKSIWSKTMNEPTFQRFMTELQVNLYNDIKNKAMGKGLLNMRKGVSEKEAADIASEAVKNFYGIVGSGKMAARSSLGKNITGATLFAPRYREAMVNFWVKNVKAISPIHFGGGGLHMNNPFSLKNVNNTKFMIGALATYAAYDYLNQKYQGNHIWDNPSGKEDKLLIPGEDGYTKGIPYLSSIATIPRGLYRQGKMLAKGDISGAAKDAGQTYLGSLVKPLVDVGANSDYFGKEIYKESDTAGTKFKKVGSYLSASYTGHPYVKAAESSLRDNEPGYQTLSKALEAPIRYYKTEDIKMSKSWAGLDDAVSKISKIPEGAERTKALQNYIASIPVDQKTKTGSGMREAQINILREKGFNTKGVSLSEDIIKFKPTALEVAKILDEGGDVDSFLKENLHSKEDVKAYSKAVASLAAGTREEYEKDIQKMADVYQKDYKSEEFKKFLESLPPSKKQAVVNAIISELDKRDKN